MKALTFSRFGGSEVLEYIEVPNPTLQKGEVLVEMKAIGLNFADIYRRKGNYHLKGKPPYIAGYEGSGVIKESKSSKYKVGERVAFADSPFSNAELVAVPEEKIIPLPDDVSFYTAASVLLQGLTAHYLATDSHKTQKGELALVHASAGGVGQLLTQICRILGARVIGLTSSLSKKQIAIACGAEEVFLYQDNWKDKIMVFTHHKGVDVVYDSVGRTLTDSFDVTRIGGQVVFFGMSGGDPAPINPRMLMDTSKSLTGGDLWNYLTSHEERIKRSTQLFDWIRGGKLKVQNPTVFPLSEGKKAHDLLESRNSTGKILLIP
ncbi:MAG: quinone oxidoreductase [Flammeovirgaceae bacterium]